MKYICKECGFTYKHGYVNGTTLETCMRCTLNSVLFHKLNKGKSYEKTCA